MASEARAASTVVGDLLEAPPPAARRGLRAARRYARSPMTWLAGLIIYHLSLSTLLAQPLQQQELPQPLSERPVPIRVTNLSIEQGLSMSVAYSIYQDRYGFIWIGGQDGVNRFDGYDMKVYKSQAFDPASFPDGWTEDIIEDEDGALWFATWDGVARMNRAAETFTHYRHDPDDPKSLASNRAYLVQPHGDGRIWVSTDVGLDLLDPVSGQATHYRHDSDDPGSISNDVVYDVMVDAAADTWFSTSNGINKLARDDQGKFSSYLVNHEGPLPSSNIYSVFERPVEPGILWLLASNALVRFDPETAAVKRYAYPFGERPRGRDGKGRIVQDPVNRNVIWMDTYGHGLLRFDIRNEQFVAFKSDRDNPSGLTSNSTTTMYVDRSGTIWVGTEASGVDRFNPASAGVTHYRSNHGLSGMLPGPSVWGISVAPDGALWVATQDESSRHRVSRINRETGAFEHYEHRTNDPGSLGAGAYYHILHDHTGTLWVTGLFGDGISRHVPSTNRWIHYAHREGDPTSLISNNVSASFEDRSGVLWFGSWDGLSRMDRKTGTFTNYPANNSGGEIPRDIVSITEDQAGTLWLSSRSEGLARFDPVTERAERFRYDVTDTNSVSSDGVGMVLERAKEPGVMWISTGSGLNRLDLPTGRFELFDESDGLANNVIYAMLEDEAGLLWMTTNRGLSRFTPETGEFRNYGLEIGLQALEFDQGSAYKATDGELFFGGINGLNAFYPNELSENNTPPEIAIVDLKLSNKSVSSSMLHLDVPLQATQELTLDYGQRDVSFDFVALHFENPEKNQYAYQLEGFDKGWVMSGHRRTASYTNLPPGQYTFRVRAANSDGVWNETGKAIAITITPPFWATWWFRIFAAMLFGGVLYGGFRLRVRQIAERNRVLEDEVATRTAELRESHLHLEQTNEQLEQSHTIVEAINQETSFSRLLTKILEEARVIPGVEKATALVYSAVDDRFRVRASSGWDASEMQHIRLTKEQAHARYVEQADELSPDIFVAKDVVHRAGTEQMAEFGRVASFMVLRISVDGEVAGYLVFDNLVDQDAFDQGDVALLARLREHIQSAFIKTRILEDLQGTLNDLRSTQDRLIQSEKMASLGQLTAGIAHEIKNPLNFVNNFSEVTTEVASEMADELSKHREEMPPSLVADFEDMIESLKRNAQKITEHGKRADAIVQNMLEHSKSGEGERHPTDLNDLLGEYLALAGHSLEARGGGFEVAFERHFDDSVGKVDIVPQELGRVFMNLVSNAFDALKEHGAPSSQPKITVTTAKSGSWVEIRVADNGPGIPEKVKAKIFEPFFTTKPTGSGTGLGLSMSYDIVTKGHGGTLDVVSEEGHGATFVVRLPI